MAIFQTPAVIGYFIFSALAFTPRSPAADVAPASTDLHTFTNDSGTTIKAQITSVTGDEVSLKREDGQAFHTKVAIFSKDDQTFIRLWAAKNAAAHGEGAFSFHALSNKGIITSAPDPAAHNKNSSWKENYTIKMKNLTLVTWLNLHVRYIVIKQSANPGQLPPNDISLKRTFGSFDAEKYSGGEEKSFPTEKVDMLATVKDAGYYYTNGAPKNTTDKFKGVWIRVYDDEENLLQEWASDPDILKSERWTFPRPPSLRAGTRGPNADPYSPAPGQRTGTARGSSPSSPPADPFAPNP